jgi:hypothetical protein
MEELAQAHAALKVYRDLADRLQEKLDRRKVA